MTDKDVFEELRVSAKRSFIIIILLIVLLFISNFIWLNVYTLPIYETTETYELDGEEDSNVVYNSEGNVKINSEEE